MCQMEQLFLRKPVPGAYAGMHVKPAKSKTSTTDSIQ